MKITHLYHSGVVVETENAQLFFDVISDIESMIDVTKKVYFFVTHVHGDHFSNQILKYKGEQVKYVFSDDVTTEPFESILWVKPGGDYTLDDMQINTYASTDRGVSFLIKIHEKVIFHAGDLNWWHWENAPVTDQEKEAHDYKTIVDGIEDVAIDIAFIPVDPRLKGAYYYAAKYFLESKRVKWLMPIHFGDHYDICSALIKQMNGDPRIMDIKLKNQSNQLI